MFTGTPRLVGIRAYLLICIIIHPKERNIDMIAYGCLAVLFLFVLIKSVNYFRGQKTAPLPEELDETLLTIANPGDRHG